MDEHTRTRVMAKKRAHIVYNIISKSREWLTVNCVMNVTGTVLPRFYIFRGKIKCDDYIK
jgi:hypothetical protein